MEEELGELGVGVVVLDQNVIGRQVLPDRLIGTTLAPIDRVVDRPRDHC